MNTKYKFKSPIFSRDRLLEIKDIKGSVHFCESLKCEAQRERGTAKTLKSIRLVTKQFYLLDYPFIGLCNDCAKEWMDMWESPVTGWVND